MNQLLVKVRDRARNTNKYRKLLSDTAVYAIPDNLAESIAYSPSTLSEDDVWFAVSGFSLLDYCPDIIKFEFNSVDYEEFSNQLFDRIDFLCSYQDGNFFFQNISKTQLIRKKRIGFGERLTYDENDASITINNTPDAIYLTDNDTLYFRKLSSVSPIFKGIDQLHRAATEDETEQFLALDFISLGNGFSSADVKIQNRKRIALAMDTLKSFAKKDKQTVFSYIREYCPELKQVDESFAIESEAELKSLLYGIEQRYYTTPVGDEKRIANSVIALS